MIYVDKTLNPPPPIFFSHEMEVSRTQIANFYQSGPTNRQKRFSDDLSTRYRSGFLPALRDEFSGKCAYCESGIDLATSHSEYDHFRPKSNARGLNKEISGQHYWWLVYEWQNIYYACTRCNIYKGTWFPVEGERAPVGIRFDDIHNEKSLLVDPCRDEPSEHFSYLETGEIVGLSSKGFTTIETLKLNRVELVDARRQALESIKKRFELFDHLSKGSTVDFMMLNQIAMEWHGIFSDRSTENYLGIKRFFLSSWLRASDLYDYLMNREFIIESDESLTERIDRYSDIAPNSIPFEFEQGSVHLTTEIRQSKHIFIEKLEIHNFKCFENLTVEFNTPNHYDELYGEKNNPQQEPWILFLGENGVGKSSLLKAFAVGLAGWEYFQELGLSGAELLRNGSDSGYIKLHMVGTLAPVHVTFTATELTSNISEPLINFVAYNAIRLKHDPPYLIAEQNKYPGAKAKNLFDYKAAFIDCEAWLMALSVERFNQVALALKDLMSLDNEDQILIEDGRTFVLIGNQKSPVNDLSDGYQSIFYMAIDIMAAIEPLGMPFELSEGMIIIDEIGAHLHPRWRMEVVTKLRRTFPKMRFVVSTHEPLCLRGMRAGEILVLEKDEYKKVQLLSDLPDPSELRVDQLLTSDFFGLYSTMDSKTENDFSEYYDLLAKRDGELSDQERERLTDLKKIIPRIRNLGDSERDNIIYEVVDKLLAEKKAHDPFRSVQEIKKEAFARLRKIWNIS